MVNKYKNQNVTIRTCAHCNGSHISGNITRHKIFSFQMIIHCLIHNHLVSRDYSPLKTMLLNKIIKNI
jgi:hypothetical protein